MIKILKKLKERIKKILEKTIFNELVIIESLFFIGILILIITNYLINIYLGMYTLALSCISLSIFLFKFRKRGDKK